MLFIRSTRVYSVFTHFHEFGVGQYYVVEPVQVVDFPEDNIINSFKCARKGLFWSLNSDFASKVTLDTI